MLYNSTFFLGEKIEKSNLIDIIPSLSPAWYVSFEINPYSGGDWLSVVHFTISGSRSKYGDRVPEVLMHYSRLYIYNAVNGHISHTYVSNPLTFNKYTRVEISQKPDSSDASVILYTIKLDGKQVYQIVNRDARYFPNVKVYQGDIWRYPAKAFIKNFVYNNLPNSSKFFL